MKQRYIGLLLIFSLSYVYAQNSTGINNTTPSTKAAMDIRNSTGFPQGVLFPRLPGSDTLALKTGVSAREKGLTFFDTTNNVFCSWNGSRWVTFGSCSSASGGGITGTGSTNTIPYWTSTNALGFSTMLYNGSSYAIGATISNALTFQVQSATTVSMYAQNTAAGGTGVWGYSSNTGGVAGIRGVATGTGKGVYGSSSSATGFGGHFENSSAGGAALITGPGNAGIGLPTPLLPLHINIPAAVEPPLTGSSAVGALRMSTGDSPVVLDMGIADDAYNGAWLQVHYDANHSIYRPLLLNPNGGSVGIGITTPTSPLHVSANNAINIPLAVLNSVSYGKIDFLTNGSDIMHVRPSGTGGKYMYFTHASGPEITLGSNGISGWFGTSTAHNLSIVTNGTPRITILPTGLIGIGCTAPTAALHVSGAIRSNMMINTVALACSDMRYKKEIKTITQPIELLGKLNGRTFQWKKGI